MDDDVKSLLRGILAKLETFDQRFEALERKVDGVIAVQAEHSAQLADVRQDMEELGRVAAVNHLKATWKTEVVINMLAEHMASAQEQWQRRRG